ncbi:MAG TPA: hypothetical protein PLY87_18580 [Planctomycetaceae bacterium]|nr:hypothetical protein [Planctomycetaceae bacterium]HRA86852.1 hypothetical protein [Planctomycetaceae bacterium]
MLVSDLHFIALVGQIDILASAAAQDFPGQSRHDLGHLVEQE